MLSVLVARDSLHCHILPFVRPPEYRRKAAIGNHVLDAQGAYLYQRNTWCTPFLHIANSHDQNDVRQVFVLNFQLGHRETFHQKVHERYNTLPAIVIVGISCYLWIHSNRGYPKQVCSAFALRDCLWWSHGSHLLGVVKCLFLAKVHILNIGGRWPIVPQAAQDV
jgi:hypothetical protein